MIIIDYYEESNIKKKRRGNLLNQCNKYFHKMGLNKATMSDIALFLNIERRTLYAYYNNITDLIVDAHLYRSEKYLSTFKSMSGDLRQSLEGKNTREQIRGYFEFIRDGIIGVSSEFPEFLDFETYFKHLDPESDTKKRFGIITNKLKITDNGLKQIISYGIKTGDIKDIGMEAEVISVVLNQSYRAYLNKTLIRQDGTGRYRRSNLDTFLEILIEGICV